MHPKGTSFRTPAVNFIERLDLRKNPAFQDGNQLETCGINGPGKDWYVVHGNYLLSSLHWAAGLIKAWIGILSRTAGEQCVDCLNKPPYPYNRYEK
jgi:hypothetical protein